MRLVLDTNLLVSALLKPGSVPDRALEAVWSTGAVVLYDSRLEAEYRDVLMRPKFRAIERHRITEFLARLAERGEDVGTVPAFCGDMTDDDDRMFVEVALAGRADAIVTGNLRHYPNDLGFAVHPPASLLAMLE
jgi:putative PIN family toxin of toxin-antitoxin system